MPPDSVGHLRWAIRESLLRYVTGIAGGTVRVDGGATIDANGCFVFPVRKVIRRGDDWGLAFSGSVHLVAHHGVLDVTIAEPELLLGPPGGILIARTGDVAAPIPVAAVGAVVTRTDGASTSWTSAPAQLLDSAVALFGSVYPAGTPMSPLDIRVPLD